METERYLFISGKKKDLLEGALKDYLKLCEEYPISEKY